MTNAKIVMSDKLCAAIGHVSGDCAGELELADDEFGDIVPILAETAIDAGRLTTWGYPEQDKEIHALIEKHGYDAVLEEAGKHVNY